VSLKTRFAKGENIDACSNRELHLMSDVKRPAKQKPPSARSHSQSDPAPALEPVTANEVRIKLDLARQFLDMGDPESARHMLDEVITEGDPAQKLEAKRLMDSLP
jgi:pilus assembly protein FimV